LALLFVGLVEDLMVADLQSQLIHFLTCERSPMTRDAIAAGLALIGRGSDQVPSVPANKWLTAIQVAVDAGDVIETDGAILVDRAKLAIKPGMLF
jgi:hypothetical protein